MNKQPASRTQAKAKTKALSDCSGCVSFPISLKLTSSVGSDPRCHLVIPGKGGCQDALTVPMCPGVSDLDRPVWHGSSTPLSQTPERGATHPQTHPTWHRSESGAIAP